MDVQQTLASAPTGVALQFERVEADPSLSRRLAALGFRRGTPVSIVQKVAGGGRLISVAGSRIAMSADLLKACFVSEAGA